MTSPDPDLKSLFCEALERPGGPERDAYLEDACRGNPALKAGVEELLAAHDQAGRFLAQGPEGPVADGSETLAATGTDAPSIATNAAETIANETHESARTSASETLAFAENGSGATNATTVDSGRKNRPGGFVPGQVIALRYTLRNLLGEGGLGTVYLAEQTEPVKRQVALKLIKLGMDSRAVLARFDAERQALALMDHPNIARVYDGGTTETGQPFFVMELVNGLPITDYCDRKRLPVRARLELFVAVCQAVQHAHQKGIIHRDLKPSNVMVTEVDGRPTPKVIDFGVAKATEFDLTDQSLGDTGAIVGTPTYMSPEQADPSSMDIDTRTDVYALGVILYELLAGSPPLDASQFKRGALLEMLRMVREVDPPRPSTKVSTAEGLPSIAAGRSIDPAQLKRALTGDLDWIVMKALEKDRTRRYETANGFAADINRHLSSEPVLAAPPSRVYRTKKFVRRHRNGVLAASLVLLSLLGGLAAVAAVQTAANARLAASLTRETNANTALNEANGQLTKSRAAVEARYKLATDAIKTFHTGVSEDFLLKEEKFKELRNRLLKSAADFYGKLGALLGKETDIASRRALAQSNFELADLTGKVGRNEDALAAHRAVLAAREALAAEPGAGAVAKVDVGRSLIAVAGLLEATGKTDEALASYRRSESLLAGPAGADPSARAALAACRSQMGWLLTEPRASPPTPWRPTGWRGPTRRRWPPLPKPPTTPATTWRTRSLGSASCWGRRASRQRRRPSTAGRWRSTRSWPTTTPPSPNSAAAWRCSHNDLGLLLDEDGQAGGGGGRVPQGAGDLCRSWPTTTPPSPNSAADLAWSHNNLGWSADRTRASRRRRRPSSARRWRSTRSWPTTTPPSPTSAAPGEQPHRTSASCCRRWASRRRRRPSAARRWRSGRSWPTTTPPSPNSAAPGAQPRATSASCCRRRASRRRRRPSTARRWRSARSWPTTTPPSPTSATTWRGVTAARRPAVEDGQAGGGGGRVPQGAGDPAEAGRRQPRRHRLPQHLADSHLNLGILLSKTGKPAEAEAEYRKALAIRQKLVDDNPADTGFRSSLAMQRTGGQPLQPRHPAVGGRASQRRRRPSTARRWRSGRSWSTTTPLTSISAMACPTTI